MLEPLRALATGVEALAPGPVETRCYVDTGPVLERVFAARAGLGWQGKNTCLIDRELGSRMLLGVVLCSLDLVHDVPEADHCGTCRACLDACPTNAFEEPYVLDARKCISYNTIESREGIDPLLRGEHGDWAFGCDICQDVCPWNRRREAGDLPDPMGLRGRLAPDPQWVRAELRWVLSLDEEAWRAATRGSALRRSRYRGLMRNALVAAGNSGDSGLVALVEGFASGEDTMLAEHARWALARL
jgi:epoxyqueuosine reductase